jgi:hypothetical protein
LGGYAQGGYTLESYRRNPNLIFLVFLKLKA